MAEPSNGNGVRLEQRIRRVERIAGDSGRFLHEMGVPAMADHERARFPELIAWYIDMQKAAKSAASASARRITLISLAISLVTLLVVIAGTFIGTHIGSNH